MIAHVTCVFCLLAPRSALYSASEAVQSNVKQLAPMMPCGADSEYNDVLSKPRFLLFAVLDPHCSEKNDQSSDVSISLCCTQLFMLRTERRELAALQSIAGDEVRT